MKRGDWRTLKGWPSLDPKSDEYAEWLKTLEQVDVPYEVGLMFGRFYVNGCRIRFHCDGSMATILTSFYCVNTSQDGSNKTIGLVHVVKYDDEDDDGVNDSDVWQASLLHRASVAISMPADWYYQRRDRLQARDYLMKLHNLKPITTNAKNNDGSFDPSDDSWIDW